MVRVYRYLFVVKPFVVFQKKYNGNNRLTPRLILLFPGRIFMCNMQIPETRSPVAVLQKFSVSKNNFQFLSGKTGFRGKQQLGRQSLLFHRWHSGIVTGSQPGHRKTQQTS